MDREELYEKKIKQLFGNTDSLLLDTDPEFTAVSNKFIFGEVYNHGKLTDMHRL